MAEGIKTIPVPVDVIARIKDICTALKDIAAELSDFCVICDQVNDVLTLPAPSEPPKSAPRKKHKTLGSRRWTDQEKAFVRDLVDLGASAAKIYDMHQSNYPPRTYKAVEYVVTYYRNQPSERLPFK